MFFFFIRTILINDPPAHLVGQAHAEASMPARSFVVGDGARIVGERAKPTTRARLPKRVRPTSRLPRPQKKGGCKEGVALQHTGRRFQILDRKVGRKWVKPVGVLNTDLPAGWPNIWRLRPSAGRPGGRPLRFVVFHIARETLLLNLVFTRSLLCSLPSLACSLLRPEGHLSEVR